MSINAGDVLKATARLEWAGSVAIQNTFFAESLAATTVSDEDAMDDLAEWLEDIYTPIIPQILNTVAFVDIQFHEMKANRPVGSVPWPTLTTGSSGGDAMASGVAAVVTAYTTINRVRGRKFFGLFSDGEIAVGKFVGAILVNLASAAAVWITSFAGGTSGQTWVPGVWRRNSATFIDFSDVVVRAVPGYQRRRKQNVGI